MDAAPRAFEDLPQDPELCVPVPFACGTDVGFGDRPEGAAPSARALDRRRVTQCALSRVCGVCGAGLGRPLALVGTPRERGRNAFHFPASHVGCLEALVAAYAGLDEPLLGLDTEPARWQVVTTAAFEFVRANREDEDRRPTFQPSALL